jgi:hypothetical protein
MPGPIRTSLIHFPDLLSSPFKLRVNPVFPQPSATPWSSDFALARFHKTKPRPNLTEKAGVLTEQNTLNLSW